MDGDGDGTIHDSAKMNNRDVWGWGWMDAGMVQPYRHLFSTIEGKNTCSNKYRERVKGMERNIEAYGLYFENILTTTNEPIELQKQDENVEMVNAEFSEQWRGKNQQPKEVSDELIQTALKKTETKKGR